MEGIEVLHPGVGVAVVALRAEHDVTTKCGLTALLQDEVSRNDLVVVDALRDSYPARFENGRYERRPTWLSLAPAPLTPAVRLQPQWLCLPHRDAMRKLEAFGTGCCNSSDAPWPDRPRSAS